MVRNQWQSAGRRLQLLRSNASSMYSLEIERANGLPITVTCSSNATATSGEKRAVILEFDYEFEIVDPKEDLAEVMKQDLPKLEFFILYYLAQETGLLECDLDRQAIPPIPMDGSSGAMSPTSIVNGSTVLNVEIVSLSSTSTDARDWTVGT
jgi:hypothetical protein